MGVVYDELFISTMKEIDVCKGAIKKLSRTLEEMEKRYGISTDEFMERFGGCAITDNKAYTEWHDSFVGLMSWQKRLRELEDILANAAEII